MSRTLFCLAALAGAPSSGLPAQTPVARIDQFLARHLKEIPVPGFSAVVVKDGKVIFSRGYGVEVLGQSRPLTSRSPIAIGSQTKSFTAVALMRLVEQGKVDLDQPVVKYLPWFRTADRRGGEITIRMLITNTSGLPSQDRWLFDRDSDEGAIERGVRDLSRVPLVRAPGKSFEYANENWTVAGAVITAVTGKPYSTYLQDDVLGPLGMSHSSTALARFPAIGALWGHLATMDGVVPARPRFIAVALPAGSELRVSADDMGKYLAMFLNYGRTDSGRLLSEASVRKLYVSATTTTASMPEMGMLNAKVGYALGWLVGQADGRTLIHHGGDAITMGSWTVIDTAHRVAASLLYNGPALDAYRYPSKIWVVNNLLHLALGEPVTDFGLPKEKDPTLNSWELPDSLAGRYLGTYLAEEGQKLVISREAKGSGLRLDIALGSMSTSYHVDFASEASAVLRNISLNPVVAFTIAPGGRVTGLAGGLPGGVYRRRSETELARVRAWRSPSGRLGVELPRQWEVQWSGERFTARDPADSATVVTGSLAATGDTVPPAGAAPRLESIGRYEWKRWWSAAGGRQRSATFARDGGAVISLTVDAPAGRLTAVLRDVLVPLQQTIEVGAER